MPEKVLYVGHPSMFRSRPFTYSFVFLLMVAGLGAAGQAYFREAFFPYMFHTGATVGGLAFINLFYWWLRGKATRLTLTEQKTTLHKGILSRNITEVYHTDVRNVQLSQTLQQRIFSVGTIGIASAGQAKMEIYVEGMPNPDEVKLIIDKHRTMNKSATSDEPTPD
jgi:uncharacterized membrane protein YdbT with pleckstrin-like domain